MTRIPGVTDVHDLHVWSLTSGVNALSAHVVRAATVSHDAVLDDVRSSILKAFPIIHVTLQVESERCAEDSHT